ncbi:DUF6611 family protein [Conyzicola sp.]|uniref:DUF6611 family protein n=1 Tax=Conyzicola sp. TaxID=1969404 RepID=UPI003989C35D
MTLFHSLTASHHAHAATRAVAHAAEHVLEGSHHWGRIEARATGRTTANRTRLTVYPPDTTPAERRALQFYRTWPIAGAVLGLMLLVALGGLPLAVVAPSLVSVYAGGTVAAFVSTTRIRSASRHVDIVSVPIGGSFETVGDIGFFNTATDRLRAMDTLNDRGLLTRAEYDALWAGVYEDCPRA